MFFLLWLLCVVAAIAARELLNVAELGIDDAYIFFVYAENFANGDGMVYNVGSERVEGFSSMLWMLLLSVFFWAGLDSYTGLFVLTSLFAAGSLWAVLDVVEYRLRARESGARLLHSRSVPLVLIVLLAWLFASPGWFVWNVASLMDLAVWGCLLCLTVRKFVLLAHSPANEIRDLTGISLLLAMMLLARPEAMGWSLFFITALVALLVWKGIRLFPLVILPVMACCGTLAALIAFRLFYFGYPLPNTYYAKVGGDFAYNISEGAGYIGGFLRASGFISLAVIGAAVVIVGMLPRIYRSYRSKDRSADESMLVMFFLAAVLITAVVFAILVGGDHFGGFRIMQPIYPVAVLFAFYCWEARNLASNSKQVKRVSLFVAPAYVLAAFLLTAFPIGGAWYSIEHTYLDQEFDVAEEGLATATALTNIVNSAGLKELPSVGVTGAGGFKYGWSGQVVDLLGLNFVAMAHSAGDRKGEKGHSAFDVDIFYRNAPDIMLPHQLGWPRVFKGCAELVDGESFQSKVLDGLPVTPEFLSRYKLVALRDSEYELCMFATDAMLEKLQITAGG
jgi:arabinofuranosyltransferase